MAVGRPSPEKRYAARPRMTQQVVLHHDRHDATHVDAAVEDHEAAYRAFREGRTMKPQGWCDAACVVATDKG